jgi:7 transmembrane receptor (rhodopsin family)
VGLFENSAVLLAITRSWHVRPSLNMYLLGLAIIDLLVCAYLPVVFLSYMIYSEWVLGMTACYIYVYGEMILVYFELFIVCAIFVTLSFFGSINPRKIGITMGGLLLSAIILTAPQDLVHRGNCFQMIWFHNATLLLKVLGPTFLLAFFFIAKALKKRYAVAYFGELKSNRLAMVLIVSYIVHWIPITYSSIVIEVTENYYYDFFGHLFSTCLLVARPVLYFWTDEVFKNEFKKMVSTCSGHTINRALLISEQEVESSLDDDS